MVLFGDDTLPGYRNEAAQAPPLFHSTIPVPTGCRQVVSYDAHRAGTSSARIDSILYYTILYYTIL